MGYKSTRGGLRDNGGEVKTARTDTFEVFFGKMEAINMAII